jgi:predicted DNA binding protein
VSVVAEFHIESSEFLLGTVVGRSDDVEIELERVIPVSERVMPYLWATAPDFAAFEAAVRASDRVDSFVALDRVDDRVLYRVEWAEEIESLVYGFAVTDGTILEAVGRSEWSFRVRFPDHTRLTEFHEYCRTHAIEFELRRVYQPDSNGQRFNLTTRQREALVLAVEWGYFRVPRDTTLGDIATELGVSEQAVSERVRRGANEVLSSTLLNPN